MSKCLNAINACNWTEGCNGTSSPKRVNCEIMLNEKLDRMSPFTAVSVQNDTYPNTATWEEGRDLVT